MIHYSDKIVLSDMREISANKYDFDKLNNKSFLITGARGMLAKYLIFFLSYLVLELDYNIEIYAVAREHEDNSDIFEGLISKPFFHLIEQDVREKISLDINVDYYIIAAGNASPKYINSDPETIIETNVLGAINAVDYASKHDVEKILFLSTREIYGEIHGVEYISEEDMGILHPDEIRSCYPESKRMAECILKSAQCSRGINYVSARIAHVYGPGMNINGDGRVMSDFIEDTVKGKDIVLNSDGSALRAFCYLSDAVSALILLLISGKKAEAYNVANENEEIMIRDMAALLVELYPFDGRKLQYISEPSLASGYCSYKRVGLNTDKIRTLGWTPGVSLREGLKRTVESFINV